MLLAVENWETNALEVAMLIDEGPNRKYLQGAAKRAPWTPGGPLAEAALTADLYGYAWFTIVFRKDSVHTWGKKRVKVVAGGRIFTPVLTKAGVETGELRELGFEKLAPNVFNTMYGRMSELRYRVVETSRMMLDPDLYIDPGRKDDVLGYREVQFENPPGPEWRPYKHLSLELGCVMEWIDEKQCGEQWFLMDESKYVANRFELTEFQRRPFVRNILVRLGFENEGCPPTAARVEQMAMKHVRGHIQIVAESLRALSEMLGEQERAPEDAGRAHRLPRAPKATLQCRAKENRNNNRANGTAAAAIMSNATSAGDVSAAGSGKVGNEVGGMVLELHVSDGDRDVGE